MRLHRPITSLLVLVLVAVPAAAQPIGIHWQQDIESAKTLARDTGRLVLIHFWTPSCGPCMMLDKNVFNQPGVGTAIESQFVPVKLDANENSATAVGFGITRVPTDVVITPEGDVVGQLISPPTPSAYVSELRALANQYATRSGQTYAQAAAAAPFEPPKYVNPAYANLPLGSQVAPAFPPTNSAARPDQSGSIAPSAAAAMPAAMLAAAAASSPGGAVPQSSPTGRYATFPTADQTTAQYATNTFPNAAMPAQGYGMQPPAQMGAIAPAAPIAPPAITPPAVVANRYATPPQFEAVPPSVAPVAPAASQQANPYTAVPPQSPQSTVMMSASQASQAASATAPDTRRLRPGAPPLGFEGYCPVSMRNHWKWVPGNPEFGIIHRGRTYWFAGAEEQQQFWANPDHFSPALSGIDPVLAVDHKQQVPGKREHSLDYDNLFYLFSSEATLQQFAANPERYAATVRQAMGIPRGRIVR